MRITENNLFDIEYVPEVRLYFDESNWAENLDSLKDIAQEGRLTGDLELDGKRYEKVGVRYKGNSSFNNVRKNEHDKLPFNIKVNYVNLEQHLAEGFQTLKLSNVFRDPSFLREVLSYEIAGKYMPAPRANFVRLSLFSFNF